MKNGRRGAILGLRPLRSPRAGPPPRSGAEPRGRHPIRRPAPALAGLVAFALLLGLGGVTVAASLQSPAPPASSTSDQAAPPQVIEAGRGLYVANCASCHGSAGQGTDNAPSLQSAGAAAADFYLRTGRMPLGAPGQQAVRQPVRFSVAQIEALVAYVASLGNGPGIPQVQAGGDVHRGWELYSANCAACHSVSGAGNAIGGGFSAPNLSHATPQEIAEAMKIGPGAMPPFGFSTSDQASIIAYLRYLRTAPSPGGAPIAGTGPVAEGFIGLFVALPMLVVLAMFAARALSAHVRVPESAAPAPAAPRGGSTSPGGPAPAGGSDSSGASDADEGPDGDGRRGTRAAPPEADR